MEIVQLKIFGYEEKLKLIENRKRVYFFNICDVFCDLVPNKKRVKHPRRSVTFSKVVGWSKLLHGCFSCLLNCANGTKSLKASHVFICQSTFMEYSNYSKHIQTTLRAVADTNIIKC